MLTPEQIQEIRTKSGLKPIATKANGNFVGKYDYLKEKPKEGTFLGNIGAAVKKRYDSVKKTFVDSSIGSGKLNSDKLSPQETTLQVAGQAAGLVNDILGEGISKLTPEPVKAKLAEVFSGVMKNEDVSNTMYAYEQFKEKYPQAAKDLESVVNITSLFPIGKAGQITAKGVKVGVEGIETGVKAGIAPAGKILSEAGQKFYKKAIPPNIQEAEAIQAYKAQNPLLQRLFKHLEEQPRTAAITALDKGFAGTEEMIGIQAKREAENLWNNIIVPAVKGVKQKFNFSKEIEAIEQEVKSTAEATRRNALLEAVQALKEDYKGVTTVSFEKAQEIKRGLRQFIPEKTYRGKPIGSAFKDIQNMLAKRITNATYDVLSDVNIKADYLDYGNLIGLAEFGQKAMTGAKAKAGFGSFVSNLFENATTPLYTAGGKVLNTVGKKLQNTAKKVLVDSSDPLGILKK